MITIRDFMEAVQYRITEGNDYTWHCFGDKAYSLSSWDGRHDNGATVDIVFDTHTQTVYQMTAHDYSRERSYRWTHPDYRETYRKEALTWFGGDLSKDVAYDDVKFVDLDSAETMIARATAIARHEQYDDRVSVEIVLDNSEWYELMKLAHQRDMTLNMLVEEILWNQIRKEQSQVDNDIK